MVLFGIDISGAQGTVDFNAVKASGVSFVIAKVSEGHTWLDPRYASNKRAIPAAGLVPGAYHFLRPNNGAPVSAQADWFIQHADPNAIHALDVEAAGPLDVAGWMHAYRNHYPHKPVLIYTGPDLWRNTSKVVYDGAEFGPLWTAGYRPNRYVSATGSLTNQWKAVTGNCGLPWLGWSTWTIMQFTDHAIVPGVSGGVDGDAFGGTLDDLKKLTGQGQEDDSMSAQDVADLKAYIDSKIDDIAKGVWDALITQAWDGQAKPARSVLSSAQRYAIEAGWAGDRPAGNGSPNTPTFAKSLAAGIPATVDPAAVASALQAALAQTGNVLTADQVRTILVDVLEGTRLSAAPPPA